MKTRFATGARTTLKLKIDNGSGLDLVVPLRVVGQLGFIDPVRQVEAESASHHTMHLDIYGTVTVQLSLQSFDSQHSKIKEAKMGIYVHNPSSI